MRPCAWIGRGTAPQEGIRSCGEAGRSGVHELSCGQVVARYERLLHQRRTCTSDALQGLKSSLSGCVPPQSSCAGSMPPNLPKTVCPSPTTEGNGTEDEALRLLTEYADDGDEAPRGDSEDAGAKVRNFLQELSDTGLLDSKGDNGNMTDEGTKEATGSDAGSGGETVAGDDAPAAPVPHADTKSDEPLPDGWEELFDPNYKATYYFCRVSGVVQWTRPDHTTSAAQAPGRPCPAATPEADATTTPAGLGQVPTSSVSAGSGAASMKESATVAEAVNAGGVEAHLRSMMESCNTCMSELDARVLSLTPYIGNADIAQGSLA
eukprot:scaffold2462_cov402-Prasinococcus_capsulatus_cf.AAC.15